MTSSPDIVVTSADEGDGLLSTPSLSAALDRSMQWFKDSERLRALLATQALTMELLLNETRQKLQSIQQRRNAVRGAVWQQLVVLHSRIVEVKRMEALLLVQDQQFQQLRALQSAKIARVTAEDRLRRSALRRIASELNLDKAAEAAALQGDDGASASPPADTGGTAEQDDPTVEQLWREHQSLVQQCTQALAKTTFGPVPHIPLPPVPDLLSRQAAAADSAEVREHLELLRELHQAPGSVLRQEHNQSIASAILAGIQQQKDNDCMRVVAEARAAYVNALVSALGVVVDRQNPIDAQFAAVQDAAASLAVRVAEKQARLRVRQRRQQQRLEWYWAIDNVAVKEQLDRLEILEEMLVPLSKHNKSNNAVAASSR